MDPAQHFFLVASIASWASQAFPKMWSSDHVHMVIVQQHLSPCKVFKGEFAKFYQLDGRASCFSHPKQGLEEPSGHYFNSL
jgi:hypothetical protein